MQWIQICITKLILVVNRNSLSFVCVSTQGLTIPLQTYMCPTDLSNTITSTIGMSCKPGVQWRTRSSFYKLILLILVTSLFFLKKPAFIAFLCSPTLPFFSECMRPLCHNLCVTSNNYLYKKKQQIFWYIASTYLWVGHPCIYCPNLSSKLDHLNPKEPSNSLPFVHYKLVTEHSFRIQGWCACVTPGYGTITAISEKKFSVTNLLWRSGRLLEGCLGVRWWNLVIRPITINFNFSIS